MLDYGQKEFNIDFRKEVTRICPELINDVEAKQLIKSLQTTEEKQNKLLNEFLEPSVPEKKKKKKKRKRKKRIRKIKKKKEHC
jgi:hypothetical protein